MAGLTRSSRPWKNPRCTTCFCNHGAWWRQRNWSKLHADPRRRRSGEVAEWSRRGRFDHALNGMISLRRGGGMDADWRALHGWLDGSEANMERWLSVSSTGLARGGRMPERTSAKPMARRARHRMCRVNPAYARRDGRVVECTGLEIRQRSDPLVGSNPTPSATNANAPCGRFAFLQNGQTSLLAAWMVEQNRVPVMAESQTGIPAGLR